MAGIYVHIPFCKTRCIYCDFFSSVSMEKKEQYINALCKELEFRKDYLEGAPIRTIYFGGGTPSQLSADDFENIFSRIPPPNPLKGTFEITLEANPDDITPTYLESIRHLPFNRISLGIQSFSDDDLRFLNRRHNAQKAIEAVALCQKYGFENISIDLMYGLPNQTQADWKNNLKQALSLGIQHISAYHLIYEEGTRLHQLLENRQIIPIDEELSVIMFSDMIDILTANGFEHYEISNFALPGYISKHNSSYWNRIHYLGIGASAHSYNGTSRQWNVSDIDNYIESVNSGKIFFETESIGEKEDYNDFILTSMRTSNGLDLEQLEILFGTNKKEYCLNQVKKHIENQTVQLVENRLKLTRKGIFISDGIMSDLFL